MEPAVRDDDRSRHASALLRPSTCGSRRGGAASRRPRAGAARHQPRLLPRLRAGRAGRGTRGAACGSWPATTSGGSGRSAGDDGMRHIPVDPGRPRRRTCGPAACSAAGEAVGVFPEAGISTRYTVRPLMPGVAALAARPAPRCCRWRSGAGSGSLGAARSPVELRRGRPATSRVGHRRTTCPRRRPERGGPGPGRHLQRLLEDVQEQPRHRPAGPDAGPVAPGPPRRARAHPCAGPRGRAGAPQRGLAHLGPGRSGARERLRLAAAGRVPGGQCQRPRGLAQVVRLQLPAGPGDSVRSGRPARSGAAPPGWRPAAARAPRAPVIDGRRCSRRARAPARRRRRTARPSRRSRGRGRRPGWPRRGRVNHVGRRGISGQRAEREHGPADQPGAGSRAPCRSVTPMVA